MLPGLPDSVVMTAEALAALQAQLEELETAGRREIAARIRTAREWGDLKENAEYHDAKNDQARLETRILLLRDRIGRADVREVSVGADTIGLGSRVELRDGADGRTISYTLVSAVEADAAAGKLSLDSPVAKALAGARVGETVTVRTPRGERSLLVVAIA
jgi:transcription elongation factor GreA